MRYNPSSDFGLQISRGLVSGITGGTTTETPVFNFAVIKAATS